VRTATMNRKSFVIPFTCLVACLGAALCLVSAWTLDVGRLDARFLLLSVFTVVFGARLTIQIPRAKAHVSVSDSFIFLVMLLYGIPAATLLAAAEALCTSLRFRNSGIKIRIDGIVFNT